MERPGAVGSSLKHMLECSVCLDNFNTTDKIPKCLVCGHTFCLLCIGKLDSYTYRTIKCPHCNKLGQIPPGGLDDLITNYTTLDLMDQTCESCRNNQRTLLCDHCNLCLCDQCHQEHSAKYLKDTKSATESLSTTSKRLRKFVNTDCNVDIDTEDIFGGVSEVLREYKEELIQKSSELEDILEKSDSFLTETKASLLGTNKDAQVKNINEECMDLFNQLDTAEKALPTKAKWSFQITVDHAGLEAMMEKSGNISLQSNKSRAAKLKSGIVRGCQKVKSAWKQWACRLSPWIIIIMVLLHIGALGMMVGSMYMESGRRDSSILEHDVVGLTCGQELFIAHRAGLTSMDLISGEKSDVLADTDVACVAIGIHGNIYVGISHEATIEVYNSDHQYRRDINLMTDSETVGGALSIAVDEVDQLFVLRQLSNFSEHQGYNIEVYLNDGTFVQTLYHAQYNETTYLNFPRSITTLGSGAMIITDQNIPNSIQILAFDGQKIKTIYNFKFSIRPDFNAVVDLDGNIVLANYWGSRLVVMKENGSVLGYLKGPELTGPSLLATCSNGDIFVVDQGNYFFDKFLYMMGLGLKPHARLVKVEQGVDEDSA